MSAGLSSTARIDRGGSGGRVAMTGPPRCVLSDPATRERRARKARESSRRLADAARLLASSTRKYTSLCYGIFPVEHHDTLSGYVEACLPGRNRYARSHDACATEPGAHRVKPSHACRERPVMPVGTGREERYEM